LVIEIDMELKPETTALQDSKVIVMQDPLRLSGLHDRLIIPYLMKRGRG
jgi:hypothetical protein